MKITIDKFKSFNNFSSSIKFNDDKFNLNVLIGRNGSGKSSFLDALAEIVRVDKGESNKTFEYKTIEKEKSVKFSYYKVIRLNTGYTERSFNNDEDTISFSSTDARKALFLYLISGFYKNDSMWNKITNIIFNDSFCDSSSSPLSIKSVWIDVDKNFEWEDADSLSLFFDKKYNNEINNYSSNSKKLIWKIDGNSLINKSISEKSFDNIEKFFDKIVNFGFFYSLNEKQILEEQFLSDGENAFLSRYALLKLIHEYKIENNEKFLILLDEPEVHFNEHWKRYFLSIVCDTLEKTNHDVFIATHSAMLVTDAKSEELHRFELKSDGVECVNSPFNTYGANIVDIGQILFKMEGDIGERSKTKIESVLKSGDIKEIDDLLKIVGPGEYRWKLRVRHKQLEQSKKDYEKTKNVIKKIKRLHEIEHTKDVKKDVKN